MTPSEIPLFVLGGSFLAFASIVGLWLHVDKAIKTIQGKAEKREVGPQPFVVQEAPRVAGHEDLQSVRSRLERIEEQMKENCDDARNQVERMADKIDAKLTAMGEAAEDRAVLLHNRINEVVSKTDQLTGTVGELQRSTSALPAVVSAAVSAVVPSNKRSSSS